MSTLGQGIAKDEMYLKAYNLAKKGEKIILFCSQVDGATLIDILASYTLEIPMEQFENDPTDIQTRNNAVAVEIEPENFIFIIEPNLNLELIEKYIYEYANEGVKHVLFDRILIKDALKLGTLEQKYKVETHFVAVPY